MLAIMKLSTTDLLSLADRLSTSSRVPTAPVIQALADRLRCALQTVDEMAYEMDAHDQQRGVHAAGRQAVACG